MIPIWVFSVVLAVCVWLLASTIGDLRIRIEKLELERDIRKESEKI